MERTAGIGSRSPLGWTSEREWPVFPEREARSLGVAIRGPYPDVEHRPTEEHDRVEVNGAGVCVLVVEDNEQVGRFATAALKELGYESELATDAAQALAMLDAHRTRYHIVFSDVVMPGMAMPHSVPISPSRSQSER